MKCLRRRRPSSLRHRLSDVTDADAVPQACWWCGAEANSREHKFKRRDLNMAFEKGSWHGRLVAHRRPGDAYYSYPNSSRADSLTFSPVICNDCNSRRSQRIDASYDQFATSVRAQGPE